MKKENVLIDKAGSTIKYSSDGPDIEDLELEEEDVVTPSIENIRKLIKNIDLKSNESSQVKQKEEISTFNTKKIKIFLKNRNLKERFQIFGKLKKFHFSKKNYRSNFIITMSVKTRVLMKFLRRSTTTRFLCEKIVVNMTSDSKSCVFIPEGNFIYRFWRVEEFATGISTDNYTTLKIKISS